MLLESFPEDYFNKKRYPKTLAWRERYKSAIEAAKEAAPKPTEIEGTEVVPKILASGFHEDKLVVEDDDPSGLKDGQEIEMAPKDTGYSHVDKGKLIGLNGREAVISALSKQDGKEIHIHYPRWNFSFTPRAEATNGEQ